MVSKIACVVFFLCLARMGYGFQPYTCDHAVSSPPNQPCTDSSPCALTPNTFSIMPLHVGDMLEAAGERCCGFNTLNYINFPEDGYWLEISSGETWARVGPGQISSLSLTGCESLVPFGITAVPTDQVAWCVGATIKTVQVVDTVSDIGRSRTK